jgi:pseudoazurin
MKLSVAKVSAALLVMIVGTEAAAGEHTIHMVNRAADGQVMAFEPKFLKVDVGDTVKFVPTNPGHNAETIEGMWPEGAEAIKGKLSQEVVLKVDKEGLYGVKCLPHYGMGMVAFVVAGKATNLDDAKNVQTPPGAKKVVEKLFEQAAQ